MPIGKHADYQLKYFRGNGSLTKKFLIMKNFYQSELNMKVFRKTFFLV